MQAHESPGIDPPTPIFGGGDPALRDRFNRVPFALTHRLADHPLFALPRLLELAKIMEARDVYYDAGDVQIGQRWDQSPPCEATVGQLLERIENAGAWIILRNIQKYPHFGEIVGRLLDETLGLAGESLRGQIWKREGIVFVTSPGRIATYHIDRECSMLLQVRGEKSISIFDKDDRDVLTEEELERFWTVDHNAPRYKEQHQGRAKVYDLGAGSAVHIPVNAPHWVKNYDDVSVSLNVNFVFYEHALANIYRANHYLRKLGIAPTPPGRSRIRDAAKAAAVSGLVGVARGLGRLRGG